MGRSTWFPLIREGTRKSGLLPWCFWPGGKPPTRMLCIRGKSGNHPMGKVYFPHRVFPGFLGPEAFKLFVIPARQAEFVCLSQLRYFASCGSRDEARTAACGGCSVRAEINRNEQCPHQADLRRLRLRTLRPLARVWRRAAPSVSFLLALNSSLETNLFNLQKEQYKIHISSFSGQALRWSALFLCNQKTLPARQRR